MGLRALDLLFYMNARHRDRELGYMMLALLFISLAFGFFGLSRAFGFDLAASLNDIYPVDLSSSPRSFLNKRAGAVVLFAIPAAVIFCWLYSRKRARRIFCYYSSLDLAVPTWVLVSYSIGLIVGTFIMAAVFRKGWPILGFLLQLGVLLFFEVCIARRLIRRFARQQPT